MVLEKKNIHFVGIGGIGMSGIAIILREMGYKVSGSDLESNDLTRRIEGMGGRVFKGHTTSSVSKDTDIVVYSSSVSDSNPELAEARRRNIPIVHRAEVLAELLNRKKGIAITGTHGKTTTTSLISVMLENCRLDPTVLIGGEVEIFKCNAKFGKGEYLVAEADESDSSFLCLKPSHSVITNIEMEHVDHFKTLESAVSAYRAFAKNLKKEGILFCNHDDQNIKKALRGLKIKTKSFGFSEGADIYPSEIKMDGFRTSFDCIYKNKRLGRVNLSLPGMHNVLNALAAILVGLTLGLGFEEICRAIRNFSGAKRRFHLRAERDDVILIDDYAHHPTEIRAVLSVCRTCKPKRLVAIFQPHRYTRTKYLADDFGRCFNGVDKLILTDIYAASEKPIEGISTKNIYDKAVRSGLKDVMMIRKDEIAGYVMRAKRRGDMIVVMGAGDIKNVTDELAEKLNTGYIAELKKRFSGKMTLNEPLSRHTSFRIGGPADIWVEPAGIKDLKKVLLFAKDRKIPVVVVGGGSNLLAKDEGFKGIIINLGAPPFKKIKIRGTTVIIGGGFSVSRLVGSCCQKGLGGLESLIGIPGTVGGAVYMNAGGSRNPVYRNIGDFVSSLKVMDYNGNVKRLRRNEIRFEYRHSNLEPYIILEATLKLAKADAADLNSRCKQFLKMKREKQILNAPSAGCVFKNPEDFQFTCGQMIDMLGLKGTRLGGAEVSERHANFIINRDGATCDDVMKLIKFIKNKVDESFSIPLELEIKLI